MIILYYLTFYLRSNGIVTEHQYGVLSGWPTELQLLTCLNWYFIFIK